MRQAGRFCDMDGTVPEKEFLARRGRKSLIPLRAGAREGVMRERNMCPDQDFPVRCKYPKIQVASERILLASTTHRIYIKKRSAVISKNVTNSGYNRIFCTISIRFALQVFLHCTRDSWAFYQTGTVPVQNYQSLQCSLVPLVTCIR